jgi:WD40 repeat protein/DNA-binding SARP family transcriptional activator
VRIAVLGPLEIDEGRILLAPRDQVVLEALAARPGETVRTEALAEALWGDHLPPSGPKVVQGCVSRLRKALGAGAIVTSGSGYRLVVHRDDVDHLCFEDLLLRAGQLLVGEPERARYAIGQALSLWRGDPLDRLPDWETGRIEAERLVERRRDAEDLFADAAIRAGRHDEVLGDLRRLVAQQPTREQRWGMLALAQYRAGRQAEALGTLARARATLVDEFGLDPGPALSELEAAILRQDPALLTSGAMPATASTDCPYLGLVAYDIDDAPAYFGRETDVSACLARLDQAGVLAVVGPSGSGKSSLIRAGVAAALVRDGYRVRVATPGPHPEDVLASAPAGSGAAFVIDQCEEALALPETSPEREAFFTGLVDYAARGPLVLSLRADRVGALAAHPDFARLVENGLYLLGAMGPAQLRRAIEGPAAQAGLRLEPGLVDLLVREAEGSPSALPLLSHVLRQTWRRREGDTLSVAGYTSTGGVREAVAQSAERVYRDLTRSQQHLLRDLMVRLVASGDANEPVRTKVPRRIVAADNEHIAVVEALVGARLLSSDGDSVEIAHESLAVAWPRLRSWLDEDVEGQRILRHLSVAADTWASMGRPDSELYRGVRLGRALEWQARTGPALSSTETAFLDASARAAATERDAAAAQGLRDRRANRRLRVLLTVAAVFAVVAAALGTVARTSARRAEAQALSADARRVGAEALTAPQPDTSLLLAAAGMRLEHNSDAGKSNLAAALNRSPMLAHVVRTPPAESVAVDPTTGRVAVSLTGGAIDLYDGRTLRLLGHSTGGGGGFAAYSPDGHILASSGTDLDVNVAFDPHPIHLSDQSAKPLPVRLGGIPPRYRSFWSLAFSGDGHRLASPLFGYSIGQEQLDVWDLRHPRHPVAVVRLHQGHISSMAMSHDGHTLYTTGDYYLRVFDAATGTQLATRTGPQLGLQALPFHDRDWTPQVLVSPDGKTLALGGNTEVALLDPVTLTTKARLEADGRITSIAFSADSRRLAIADGGVALWDLVGKSPVHVFPSPDGDASRPTRVFHAQTWGGNLTALSPDGNIVYGYEKGGVLLAWDLTGGQGFLTTRTQAGLPNDTVAVQVAPNGRAVAYLANIDARVDVRDVDTGLLVKGLHPEGTNAYGGSLTWRPDGRAVIGAAGDAAVELVDPSTGKLMQRPSSAEGVSAAQYTTDGKVVIGTIHGHIQVLDARSLDMNLAPENPIIDGPVETLALDPAEHAVAIQGTNQRVLLDYRNGHRLRSLAHETFFAPDGTTSAVVDDNGAVGFQADNGTRWIASPDPSHAYGGRLSAYSHDSSLFASSHNRQVGLWNARTGTFLGSVPVSGPVAVGFTADDSTLVLAGFDGTIQIWNLSPDAWVRAACDIAGRDLTPQEWATVLPRRTPEHLCDHVGT